MCFGISNVLLKVKHQLFRTLKPLYFFKALKVLILFDKFAIPSCLKTSEGLNLGIKNLNPHAIYFHTNFIKLRINIF